MFCVNQELCKASDSSLVLRVSVFSLFKVDDMCSGPWIPFSAAGQALWNISARRSILETGKLSWVQYAATGILLQQCCLLSCGKWY